MDKKKKSPRKSSKAPKIKDLDVQQRKLAIIKQKQCDAIALHIVRKLIDSPVEEDVFIQSLKYLNQCHYQDIVEERAITKLCGYPICGSIIRDMPAKKFHISTKKNKVYDITERKNYCSNFCYKAGVYIKDQMLSSPLWFRDKEEIPEFHLLPKTEPGIPGQEIDQGILKLDVDEEQSFTSVSEFTQDMINEIPEDIHVDAEQNTSVASEETKQKEDESKEVSENPQNQYFSSFFAPSLADILKENAAYFKNEPSNSKIDNKPIIIGKENNNIKDTKLVENVDNKHRIGFDRTIINTKSNDVQKTKGILKKSKLKSEKKRVSFSSENSVQEIEPLPTSVKNETFKKPEPSKSEENTESRFKNTNVIGTVHEHSTTVVNKPNNTNNSNKIDELNKNNDSIIKNSDNILKNETFKKPEPSKSEENTAPRFKNTNVIGTVHEHSTIFVNKPNNTNNSNKIDELNKNNDSVIKNIDNILKNETANKEARVSRLKNSASFKNVQRISKPLSQSSNSSKSPNFSSMDLTSRLESSLSEWFTFETALFLYGEENVKKIISEKSFKHYLNKKKNMELDENKQKQYEEICKRLKLMELADQKFDATVTGKKRSPLPRYEDLREASEHQDLRVQAFYSGCYEVDLEGEDTDNESVKDDDDEEDTEESSCVVQGAPAVLPLVDNKDVMATRRKIFLMSVSRAIPVVCEILEESPNNLLAEIKHLINTFDFSASNIVFKSSEWQLVTVLLIQILSVRDNDLRTTLEKKEVCLFLSSLAKQFGLSDKYIKDVLSKVKVQSLLDECMRKDCVT